MQSLLGELLVIKQVKKQWILIIKTLIWHWVNAHDNKPNIHFPKQHSWKNAFHSFEHAIVGYLTGQELHDLDSKLYFAFKQGGLADETPIRPYTYAAKVKSIVPKNDEVIPGYGKQLVTFTDIR